jgi:hypothetical protein
MAIGSGNSYFFKNGCNDSAAIHQDGEKPVLFVPNFFRELLGFLPLKKRHTE